jgi:hypothetical protein
MNHSLEFNFHDIVGIEIQSRDPKLLSFYSKEFHHSTKKGTTQYPRVRLRWERRNSFDQIPDGYQFHVHKLLARWAYRITFKRDEIQIDSMGNELAIPMVHHMLVHPATRYLSSLQNVLMLHGSAVVNNGQSIILTGKGGAGKTTTSSLLLRFGGPDWQLHADDYIFVASDQQTRGYLTRSHLYLDILKWIPDVGRLLTPWERLRLEFFGRVRSLTRDGIKWPVRLSDDRLWPHHSWAEAAKLGAVLLLRRTDGDDLQLTQANIDDRLVDDLLEMNFIEARHFCSLIENAIETGLSEAWLIEWKRRERHLIRENMLNAQVHWLDLPSRPDVDQTGEELLRKISPLIGSRRPLHE